MPTSFRSFALLLLLSFLSSAGIAASYAWTGGAPLPNWTAPLNWTPNGVPGALDTAIFNGGSVKNCDADMTTAVSSLQMNAGYSGTLTLLRDLNVTQLTVGQGTFNCASNTVIMPAAGTLQVLSGGSFIASGLHSSNLILSHVSVASGGSFTPPNDNSVLFQAQNGLQVYPGASYLYGSNSLVIMQGSGFFQSSVDIGNLGLASGSVLTMTADSQVENLQASGDFFDVGGRQLAVRGDAHFNSPFGSLSSSTLLFNGSGTQLYASSYSMGWGSFIVAKSGGILQQGGPLAPVNLLIEQGTFEAGQLTMPTGGVAQIFSGAALTGDPYQATFNNLSVFSGGIFQEPTSSFFSVDQGFQVYAGADFRLHSGSSVFIDGGPLRAGVNVGDVGVASGATVTVSGDCQFHTLQATGVVLNPSGHQMAFTGDFKFNGRVNGGVNSSLVFTGGALQVYNDGSNNYWGQLTVSKTAGTTLVQGGSPSCLNLLVAQGTFNGAFNAAMASSGSVQVLSGGTCTLSAFGTVYNFSVQSGGTFDGSLLSVNGFQVYPGAIYTPSNGDLQVVGGPFYAGTSVGGRVTFNGPGGAADPVFTGNSQVGDTDLVSVNLAGYQLAVTGTCRINGGTIPSLSSSSLLMNGNLNQDFFTNAVAIGTVNVAKGGGSILTFIPSGSPVVAQLNISQGTVASTSLWDNPAGSVTVAGTGTLDLAGLMHVGSLSIGGTANFMATNASSLQVNSSLSVLSGATLNLPSADHATLLKGTAVVQAGVALVPGGIVDLSNLHLAANSPLGPLDIAAGGVTLSADSQVSSLRVELGTWLDLGGHTLKLSGDFQEFGRASLGSGTLQLNGSAQTFTGGTVVQNLVKNSTFADTLTFSNAASLSITGLLSLQGSPGYLLSLRDSSPGTPFSLALSPTGNASLVYLDVQDSNATAGILLPAFQSVNSGNNLHWNFGAFTATPTSTASPSPTATPSATPSSTVTPTRTVTPSATPSASPSATSTATPSATSTASPTATSTASATPSDTPSDTCTVSPTATPSASASPSATPSDTGSATASATGTVTGTATASLTASITPTITLTPSLTPPSTPTPTPTPRFAASGLGKAVLAPVPAKVGQPVCLYFDTEPASTVWDVYGLDQSKVAQLRFGAGYSQCWQSAGVAPGLYLVHVHIIDRDGHAHEESFKAVLLR